MVSFRPIFVLVGPINAQLGIGLETSVAKVGCEILHFPKIGWNFPPHDLGNCFVGKSIHLGFHEEKEQHATPKVPFSVDLS